MIPDLAHRIQTWGGTAFTYDLHGNLTNDGTATLTWNARNQLAAIGGEVTSLRSAVVGADALSQVTHLRCVNRLESR